MDRNTVRRAARSAVLAALATGSGCRDDAGVAGARVRDSAGISIVEIEGPGDATPVWSVSEPASIDLGGGGGHPAYDFDAVTTVLRLTDGRLVVANGSSNEIRIFDAQGAHLKTVGRTGGGPGEFQSLMGLWNGPGDSLLAADIVARRVSVYDPQGVFVRGFGLGGEAGVTIPTDGVVKLVIPQGWLADGSIIGMAQGFRINDPRQGLYRDSLSIVRYASDGPARDTVGKFPGIEMEQTPLQIRGQTLSTPDAVPLGKSTAFAIRGDRVYIAKNDAWEIELRGPRGALIRLIRREVPAAPITDQDQERHRQERVEQMEGLPQFKGIPEPIKEQMRARVRDARYPPTFPFIANLLVDDSGHLWVQEVEKPGEERTRFVILDSTGVVAAVAVMPARFRPTAIGADAIAGIWRDDDDVEHVRVYRLQRVGGPAS
ncbi:MAG: 6-bladed beta-propeller [Gemmatimonadales bacterium]